MTTNRPTPAVSDRLPTQNITVYTVYVRPYSDDAEPELEKTEAKITPKRIALGRPPFAHHYPNEGKLPHSYAFTPREAWTKYIVETEKEITDLEEKLATERRCLQLAKEERGKL